MWCEAFVKWEQKEVERETEALVKCGGDGVAAEQAQPVRGGEGGACGDVGGTHAVLTEEGGGGCAVKLFHDKLVLREEST